MGPRHDLSFCACSTACLASELLVSMGPRPHLWILIVKQRLLVQNYKSLWVPDLTCCFVHAKHREWHQNYKSLWVPDLTCRFVHAKQRAYIRITSLYGPQPSPVVFGCITVTFGPEQQVCMGPRHDLSFCACTTACLAAESLVSMGPPPHLCILIAKQCLLVQNCKSLWVPAFICDFVDAKQRA